MITKLKKDNYNILIALSSFIGESDVTTKIVGNSVHTVIENAYSRLSYTLNSEKIRITVTTVVKTYYREIPMYHPTDYRINVLIKLLKKLNSVYLTLETNPYADVSNALRTIHIRGNK